MPAWLRPICFVMPLLVLASCSEKSSWPTTQFDSERWRRSATENRYVFAQDLIDRKLLLGKTEQAVREMLGAPTSIDISGRQFSYLIKIGGKGFDSTYTLDAFFSSPAGLAERVLIRGD